MPETGGQNPYFCKKLNFMNRAMSLNSPYHHFIIILLFFLVPSLSGSIHGYSQGSPRLLKVKNVILIIGDGMGYNAIRATDFYLGEKQYYEDFPVRLAMATYPANADEIYQGDQGTVKKIIGYDQIAAWKDTGYVKRNTTESSAAATAMATGFKTYNKAIGISMNFDTLTNLVEVAKSLGKSAGVVTTVPFSHATPAGFVAHNRSRSKYSQIARDMILRSRCDVIIGCGNPAFDDDGRALEKKWENSGFVGDSALWGQLVKGSGKQTRFHFEGKSYTVSDCDGDGMADPWTIIQSLDSFRRLEQGVPPKRILGCPEVHSTLQMARAMGKGETNDSPPFVTPYIKKIPTLADMTLGALNVMDNNPKGFFLMIEGGAIDWAEHDNQKGRTIEEMAGLNDAVKAVIGWVNRHSNWKETMVIVTGDHETGYLWGGPPFVPVGDNGAGRLPVMQFNSPDHTNSLIPLFVKGTGSELFAGFADESDSVRGPYIQNSEIPQVIKFLWIK